ncbi:structural maintenance of chromosome protein 3 [Gloeophyllum trabeum ATCC 11539]|uniref:Structural maintenance of chromosomes protein n=1 Tax=Gloeophyllum trabeum (strain ATCC 11539 / FP-39264 / Madison 617) TaxID=670483 RepID=S7Q4L3_GLOTA|nr:structural maintenance of chromosome protein 3 [Gloeophyllum trabeum ATCC 11539]EPQ54966.1 structural maintenance of chromosome protein 3 [Gloeophyllum trabeum ATCC 11539]
MYIKTLTIQGFKSYRDQTQIEPFSPRHNVVVGRNGSGKSNFFAAIRFVLSDAYTSMSREERQSLLHEGVSTTTTLSAYVEIVFDNSDNRFPTGREEVIIRRTIGLKKDEYSLDKKSVSKADVMNLLESAGFSKSNPYYIVPQGRITALTNAKDHERLALLKEVAGTKVYEQRRTESLRIMAETDAKRSKISELLDYINSRLTELEEEKEELKEFQEKDKERRCLEYAVYQRELEEVAEALEEIEEERKAEVHGANQRREQFNVREKEIKNIEREMSEAKHTLSTVTLTRQGVQSELNDLYRARTELECVVEDLRTASESSGGKKEETEEELARIEALIAQKEEALASLVPRWEEKKEQERHEKRLFDEARTKLDALNAKRGRLNRFRTKAERDAFLKKDIASIDNYRRTHEAALEASRAGLAAVQQSMQEVEARAQAAQERVEDGRRRTVELEGEIGKLKDQHGDLVERRKELWREDTKLETLLRHAQEELRSAERDLASMMDKDTGMGLRAIDRIAERHGLDGVHGPLYRLFDIPDDKLNTAVELTAGNSLFHVVVDSDATASKVLDIMLREKTGRVTFMPLNRLKPKNPPLPSAQDAIPLIEKLRYDSAYEKAFQQVFGKTCVCRDLTIAAAYVKSHNINTITLDGDKVDRKGALTGGYHDVRRSRIEAIKSVTEWRGKFETHDKRSKEVRATILQLDQQITQMWGRIQVLQNQHTQAREAREALASELAALSQEKRRLAERATKLESEIEDGVTELTGLQAKLDGYRAELASPMAAGLTDEEEEVIASLVKEVEVRQKRLADLKKERSTLGSSKELIEIELEEKLRRRREELREKLQLHGDADLGVESSADNLHARERELRALNASIDSLVKRTEDLDKEAEELNKRLQKLRADLEKVQSQQQEDGKGISKQQKSTERYLAKRQMLIGRKEECNRNIRDLGVLPEEAFEKYTNEKLDRLVKKLHAVNQGLKKFAHVNKKAFEQYNNFTKQRDQLLQRREDLDKSAESIQDLVQVLDQRKDEAIERTFKQVASNFEEVFEQLVPAGRGKLIIQRRIDRDEDGAEDDAEDTQQSSVDNYTGVSIKVSFNSKVDEGLRIQQLSGGQKSLVALATVFAIQKCDPAPFYLFDEIDANLDAQYRTAVASMIQSLASTAQFITTTFRPEMLVTADKFYGVLFNNQKVSSIRSIKREEAMEFVEQEAQAQ